MEEIKLFEFEGQEVRTVVKDEDVWFVGKDVCKVLGFTNPRDAIRTHVFDEDKGVDSIDTLGGRQNMTIINESGLYALVFGSRLESAKRFKHWVTNEVLPSIRKHGAYMTDKVLEQTLNDPDFMIGLLTELKTEREKRKELELVSQQQKQQIAELQPKADYTDKILKCKDLLTIRQIAQDYGMTATAMNRLLHELGVQYKQSGQWLLYSKYVSHGYTKSTTYVNEHGKSTMYTKWTTKGQLFLYNLLKANWILPLIEREDTQQAA